MGVMDPVERVFGAVNATVFRQVNRARDWWDLPTPVALLNLRAHRDDLRSSNLYDTRPPSNGAAVPLSKLQAPHLRRLLSGPDRPGDGDGRLPLRPQRAAR